MSVYPDGIDVARGAVLSDDGVYRYRLTRQWDPGHTFLPFIMLNPSTADATDDDPTIRRCVGFARQHGFGGVAVLNLYAYRATKPADMWAAAKAGTDIVGPDTDRRLRNLFEWAGLGGTPVVAAWGAGAKSDRAVTVTAMGAGVLHHLGLTKAGHPRHPLYIPADTPQTPWSPA